MKWMFNPDGVYTGKMQFMRADHYEEAKSNGFRLCDPKEGLGQDYFWSDDFETAEVRPTMEIDFSSSAVVGGVEVSIAGFPEGSELLIDGESYNASENPKFLLNDLGRYTIAIKKFPFVDFSTEVTVLC